MRLAFALVKYFPYGGLQRDCLAIARACAARGHQVCIHAGSWRGPEPEDLEVNLLPVSGWGNHNVNRAFARALELHLRQQPVDAVVGFNKLPGLDVYYAADSCFATKAFEQRGPLYRMTPRSRAFMAQEQAVFSPAAGVHVLLISEAEKPAFMKYYGTPEERFHLLPPGIRRDRLPPPDAAQIRAGLRREFGFGDDDLLVLMVGSGFRTKGLDRALLSLHSLPTELLGRSRLLIVGQDKAEPFRSQIGKLGLADRVSFLGGRDDVPRFLLGADLLIHPAYRENTGTVLLEAMIAGLPVLTTAVCGYAHYVLEADAGRVIAEPFSQSALNAELADMLSSEQRESWRRNGLQFGRTADIYSMPQRAAEIIEKVGERKHAAGTR